MSEKIKINIPPLVLLEQTEKEELIKNLWEKHVLPTYEKICEQIYEKVNKNNEIFIEWKNKADSILDENLEKSINDGFCPLVLVLPEI